ncbi:hypothetical protein D9758_016341 [Tetrapyrgos nigripes]|uniref:Carboxylesterase type B domain-containing protein n=1 Tax=Tetrapyrgos nigripes TaxID=182062 RepID=A0A8H5FC64_9AGAR|nr:hypothetical protein D9758_016341 [Tetrapyrgos nigripes]
MNTIDMQSGSPIPVGDITNGQKYYDVLVHQTGCSESDDTLQCLREVSDDKLKNAVDNSPSIVSYQSLNLAWLPRVDGVLLTDAPQKLVQQAKVAKIPIVSGDSSFLAWYSRRDIEGTLFSFSTLNVTTEDQIRTYIKTEFLPTISDEDLDDLLQAYPQDPAQGSPFDTGDLNAISPQFKRFASFQGDAVFQAPRRWFFENLDGKQPIWAFLSKREKAVPILGAFHGSDILIRFTANLDPNGNTRISWPQYSQANPTLLTFNGRLVPQSLNKDDFRVDEMKMLNQILLANPV